MIRICSFESNCWFAKIVAAKIVKLRPAGVQYCRVPTEERGVDRPIASLDRSSFSRLQPTSFLFFNPSSSRSLVCSAHTVFAMLHTHAAHFGVREQLRCSEEVAFPGII